MAVVRVQQFQLCICLVNIVVCASTSYSFPVMGKIVITITLASAITVRALNVFEFDPHVREICVSVSPQP